MAAGYLCSRSGDRDRPHRPTRSGPIGGPLTMQNQYRWERRSVGSTARRCRRTRPRSPISSTTAASHARCSGSCAAGGRLPRATSNCRSRAPSPASCIPPTATGWHVRSRPTARTRSQIWVVTTDPDDRDARRIDHWPEGAGGHRRTDRLGRHPGGGDSDRRGRRRQLVSDRSVRRRPRWCWTAARAAGWSTPGRGRRWCGSARAATAI